MDKQAQVEAWVRKKPKRIIHNQKLIVCLYVLVSITPFCATAAIFYVVNVYPLTVMIYATIWLVSAVTYTILRIRVWLTDR